jgi:Family of unknown function (DUF6174)
MRYRVLVLTVVLGGCGLFSIFSAESDREVLLEHRKQWQSLGLRSYDFTFRLDCSCIAGSIPPSTVEVRNGVVTKVTSLGSGAVIGPNSSAKWPTIDSLFVWTENEFNQGYRLAVGYNVSHHYPGSVIGAAPGVPGSDFTRTAGSLVAR